MAKWNSKPCYYVSVINGPRRSLLAGPYRTHKEALEMVEPAREKAIEIDQWAHFYAFGTCKMTTGERDGVLNAQLAGVC